MRFLRLWTICALAAFLALFLVLAVWLLAREGFDNEVMSLMLGYITNAPLVMLAVGVSALIGLIEAVAMASWNRRRPRRS